MEQTEAEDFEPSRYWYGAMARAHALAAGFEDWMNVTRWERA